MFEDQKRTALGQVEDAVVTSWWLQHRRKPVEGMKVIDEVVFTRSMIEEVRNMLSNHRLADIQPIVLLHGNVSLLAHK